MYEKICLTCEKVFLTRDKRKKYCIRDCYYITLKGKGNPFYGKKHKRKTIDEMKKKLSQKFKGSGNSFYGKKHSKETIDKIKKSNEEYRKKNKTMILEKRLENKSLTNEVIRETWEKYNSGPYNREWIQDYLEIDYRTFKKFVIDLQIATVEEVRETGEKKKLFQGSGVSYPETVLLELLQKTFGKENVKYQVKKFGFYYDFQVYDNYLIEYDGYYFHKILRNNNDKRKEKLAEDNGYSLIRVEEDKNRKVFFDKEIKRIINIIKR